MSASAQTRRPLQQHTGPLIQGISDVHLKAIPTALMLVTACIAHTQPQPQPEQSRGELLYGTHCINCHTEQMHWRDSKLVTDMPGLQAQVRRWQGVASLAWNDDDIREVSRFLNARYYHLAPPN